MTSLRAKRQVLPIAGVVLIVLMTFANAAANMIPTKRPSAAELRAEDQRDLIADRKARIAALEATPDGCRPASAHELARLLVMDGRFTAARSYADAYEQRCGGDP